MKLHENRCRQCKKLFCCLSCRLDHENKKHSQREIKCPLCCSEKLQIKGDESHQFICHLVFNHLPLLCRLCGQSFKSSQDFSNFKECGWWKPENSKCWLKVLENTLGSTTPLLEIKPSLNSCNKEAVSESRHSTDFVTFNSPLVLIRNTSTPMAVGLHRPKENLELRSLNSLSFFLKNPRNFSPSLEEGDTWPYFDNNELRKCNSDSQFQSGFYSQSKSSLQGSLPQKSDNTSTNTTDYYTCDQFDFGKKSELMTRGGELLEAEFESKKDIKESTKRVRFSDQFQHMSNMAENDEFFEARENLSEISEKFLANEENSEVLINLETSSDANANHENQLNVEKENKVSMIGNEVRLMENGILSKENQVCLEENEVFLEREVRSIENKIKSQQNMNSFDESEEDESPNEQSTSSNSGPSEQNTTSVQQSASSRLVMMVLVENATRLSRTELAPLIDSGLKKLEETAASISSMHSSISSRTSQKGENELKDSGRGKRSVTSVNSYLSITSTECFTAQSGSQWTDSNECSASVNVESSKSDGIFSAMARVVRSALRKFPGANSLQENSRESEMQESRSSEIASTSELPTSSYNSLSCHLSGINYPPIKRPRDPASPPAIYGSALQNEDRSPIAKRPRGWYKIRAREPIARMRKVQVTSPKGVSSEIQRFQQGSLSAGRQNTIIPLPSRAHQFTQTE